VTPTKIIGFVTSPRVRLVCSPELERGEGTLQFVTVAPSCACAALAANARDAITTVNLVARVLVIPSSLLKTLDLRMDR
jgi:hypothetical protein